jgi:hypothetical protein
MRFVPLAAMEASPLTFGAANSTEVKIKPSSPILGILFIANYFAEILMFGWCINYWIHAEVRARGDRTNAQLFQCTTRNDDDDLFQRLTLSQLFPGREQASAQLPPASGESGV